MCTLTKWLRGSTFKARISRLVTSSKNTSSSSRRCAAATLMKMSLVAASLPKFRVSVPQNLLLLFCSGLRANCAFTNKTLKFIGRAERPYSDVCGYVEDVLHIFLTSPQCASERKILRDALSGAGPPSECLRDFLFPTGPPGSVRFRFGAVAVPLANSSVDMLI